MTAVNRGYHWSTANRKLMGVKCVFQIPFCSMMLEMREEWTYKNRKWTQSDIKNRVTSADELFPEKELFVPWIRIGVRMVDLRLG